MSSMTERPDAAPLCQTCGQDWDADVAAERCTYPECPYGEFPDAAPPKEVRLDDGPVPDAARIALWQRALDLIEWANDLRVGSRPDVGKWGEARKALHDAILAHVEDAAPPPSDAAPVAPSDEAKLAFIKAHTAVMGEWEVTDGWEEALDAGLRAYDVVNAHPEDAPRGPTESMMAALDEVINNVLRWVGHKDRIPVDVRMAWRNDFRLALNRLKGDEKRGPTRLQILEAQRELTVADIAFPHEDGTYSLLLSDTFDFATADAEKIPDDDVIRLAQLYKDHGHFALIVWAEDKRGQRVIKPLREDVDKMRDALNKLANDEQA